MPLRLIDRGRALVRQAIGPWLQRQFGSTLRLVWPENWYQIGRDAPPTTGASLSFPAVFGCIDIISSDIARLPMRHWRDDGERKTEIRDSWPVSVLDKPNEYQTGFDMMKMLIASQLYRGNGYLFSLRNRRNQIDTLHPIFPDFVWPYRAAGPDYFYQVSPQPIAEIDVQRMIPPRFMFHHRMMVFNDPLIGITPMVAAATSSQAGLAILRQSAGFFTRMARPSGVLSTNKSIDRRKAEEIKERWQKVYSGEEGAGDVVVLEEGLEWKALTMTAVDAQLIEQLRYSVEDVARVYRVPPYKLGDFSKTSYSSSEQSAQDYWDGCLSAHMKALEWRLSQFFGLDGRAEYLAFDLEALFRTNMKERIEALARSVQGGIRTNNEARRIEGLGPVEGGDTVFMQQQMVPISQLATRADLNPQPTMTPMPAQTPTRDLNELPSLDPPQLPEYPDLADALMAAVFDDPEPEPMPRLRYVDSVLAYRHQQQRQIIHGRPSTALH